MKFFKSKPKVFCIGQNKTGTTSLKVALKDFGYKIGNQPKAELLIENWYQRDFKSIIDYCQTAQAFQDIPFSLPYTYQHLDTYFKNAKFILTERDDPEQWYNSLVKFHSKLWSDGESIPTASDLKKATYRYAGYAYIANRYIYNTPENDLYNKDILIKKYIEYNKNVKHYFESRPEKLLVINVSNSSDYSKLCAFLNQPVTQENFPWENKT